MPRFRLPKAANDFSLPGLPLRGRDDAHWWAGGIGEMLVYRGLRVDFDLMERLKANGFKIKTYEPGHYIAAIRDCTLEQFTRMAESDEGQ